MLTVDHFEKLESYVPLDFNSWQNFILAFSVVLFFLIFRYFLFVFPFYFFYWIKKRTPQAEYLHQKPFSSAQVQMEIKYSLISSGLFAAAGVGVAYLWKKDLTQIYLKFDHYGYAYLLLSIFIVALIHEVYFYATHRWMHHKAVFKYVHRVHHLSKNTSPWASFSFHPFEAVILALFLPLIVLIIPLHPVILILYMVFMTLSAISNHLGVEMIKSSYVLRHFISGTHHSFHHKNMNKNFGLYFCFMDRLFHTEGTTKETQ